MDGAAFVQKIFGFGRMAAYLCLIQSHGGVGDNRVDGYG